jgi:hypothetical protein
MTIQSSRAKALSPIKAEVRTWMRSLGFVHESEVEDATCTTSSFRKGWPLRPIQFGLENWYALKDIQQYLKAQSVKVHRHDVEEVTA